MSKSSANDINKDDYTKIDSDAFYDFRISDYMSTYIRPSSTARINPTSTSSTSSSYSFISTSSFKKGIKRNPNLFPKFIDSKFWDNFK